MATADWMQMIGSAIRAARERAGLRVSPLAERTKELGAPIHRVALPKVEAGESDLTLTQLVGLAAALGVPPLSLLFADVTADVEVLPGRVMNGLSAVGWFIGAGGNLGLIDDRAYVPPGVKTDDSMRIPLELLRIDQEIAQNRHIQAQAKGGLQFSANDQVRDLIVQQSEQAVLRIEYLEAERIRLIDAYRGNRDGG